jgi:hypothetical protein
MLIRLSRQEKGGERDWEDKDGGKGVNLLLVFL